MKIRKAIIPAAGFGTRLLPVTKVVPKELLPIGSKPAIQYVVEEAVASGIEEIILVGTPAKRMILDYFRPDPKLNAFLKSRGKTKELEELRRIESLVKWKLVYQKEAKGLGDAVLCAQRAIRDEPFLVMLPDVVIMGKKPASLSLIKACANNRPGGAKKCHGEPEGRGHLPSDDWRSPRFARDDTTGLSWGLLLEQASDERLSSYGIIAGRKLKEDVWKIEGAVEKPSPKKAPSDLAILGRYVFTPEIFRLIQDSKAGALGEIQLTDAIHRMAQKNPGVGIICRERIFDVGTTRGLVEAGTNLLPSCVY